MDPTRLLIVYGPPIAVGLTVLALAWLYYLTRLNRPLIPTTLGGRFRLVLLVVFFLFSLHGIMLLNMLILSILVLVWFFRKSNAIRLEQDLLKADENRPAAPNRPWGKIIAVLVLLTAAQGFLYEINFHQQKAAEYLAFYDRPLRELRYIHMDDQKEHRIAELQGKVVLINFWHTRCGPLCDNNMEQIDRLFERYKDDGLVVINLSVDDTDTLLAYLDQHPVSTLHGSLAGIQQNGPPFDTKDIMGNVTSVPTAMVIDRKGWLRQVYKGGPLDYTYFLIGVVPYL